MALTATQTKAINEIVQLLPLQEREALLKLTDLIKTPGVAVANGAVPFADLTAASNKVNELLASLRTAGVIAP